MEAQAKARVIALYLPQFHPIPENDAWWGKGFTEWTNVGKAKPLFKGHYQPRVPADLGYYDLRVTETRIHQAELAREYGVEGFCYWHYWFGDGKRLLERPFNEVLESKQPDFPFCLAWANESWKGFAHGLTNRNLLIEQKYPGIEDYINHFYSVLPALKDKRYITVNGLPLFVIYKPLASPEIKVFIKVWRDLAIKNNLGGIYFVAHNNDYRESVEDIFAQGFDALNTCRIVNSYIHNVSLFSRIMKYIKRKVFKIPLIYDYEYVADQSINKIVDSMNNVFPSIFPGWDHSPRSKNEGLVLINSEPEKFDRHVKKVLSLIANKKHENKIVFLKSWNEWAEGNYVEPDLKYGKKYLEIIKKNMYNI